LLLKTVPLGIGRGFAIRRLAEGGWVAILAAIAIVLLVIYWPRIVDWIERSWRSR
jgi:K+ transporter